MKMAVGCLLFKGAVSRILSKFKQEPPPNMHRLKHKNNLHIYGGRFRLRSFYAIFEKL